MSRLFPFPLFTLLLLLLWLLLGGFSGEVFLTGVLVATLAPRLLLTLKVERPRVKVGWAMGRLAGRVLLDILRSNLAVAKAVITGPDGHRRGFIRLPTVLRQRSALAILATIITATPGTLWVAYDAKEQVILIHVLDLANEAALVAHLKGRYEALLLEIFP